MKIISASYLDTGEQLFKGHGLLINDHGQIQSIAPLEELTDKYPEIPFQHHKNHVIIPGCINSHSHAFQVFLRGWGNNPANFQAWVNQCLYPLVLTMDKTRLYHSALLAFSEMLLAGVTCVGEFYYIQNTIDGHTSQNENAHTIIQAAQDVGIRISMIRTLYDQQHKEGQRLFKEPVTQAIQQTRELAAFYQNHPMVSVLPAPHSLHGASREMIEAGFSLAEELDTRCHIHLSEQQNDIPYSQKMYGTTPVKALHDWGVLNNRTVLVHGIWLEQDEKELMGQQEAKLAYNPLTNMALGDGIADIPELFKQHVSISLGTDANNQLDIFAEARTAEYLQRVQALKMGIIPQTNGLRPYFHMANLNGGINLGLPVGKLAPDYLADCLVVDLTHPSLLPGSLLLDENPDALINSLLFSMVPQQAIKQSFVGGELVVENGCLVNLSQKELYEKVKDSGPFKF